jgi:hypothetical protein
MPSLPMARQSGSVDVDGRKSAHVRYSIGGNLLIAAAVAAYYGRKTYDGLFPLLLDLSVFNRTL